MKINADKVIMVLLLIAILLPSSYSFINISIFKIISVMIGIIFIYLFIKRPKDVKDGLKNKFVMMNFVFSFAIFLSLLFNCDNMRYNDFYEPLKYIIFPIVTLIIIMLCSERENYKFFLKAVSIAMIIICIFGIIQYFNPFSINEQYIKSYAPTQYDTLVNNYPTPRIVGVKSNPSVYGILVALGIYFNLMYYKYARHKSICVISIILCFINLMMTLTRTIQLAFIISIFVYVLIRALIYDGAKKAFLYLTITIVIFASILMILPSDLTWRLSQVMDLSSVNSWNERVEKWKSYYDLIERKLLLGMGPTKNYTEQLGYVDSELIQNIIQYGLIGFIAYIIMLISPFIIYRKNKKNKNILLYYIPILCIIFINNIPSSTLLNFETAMGIYVIIGIILTEIKNETKTKNIIFNTVLPLWSMNNKSGGKALFSTIDAYIKDGYNVFLVTDQKNDYSVDNIKIDNVTYIDMTWKDKILRNKIAKLYGASKVINWIYSILFEKISYREMENIIINNGNAIIYAYEVHAVKGCKRIATRYQLPLITRFQGTVMAGKKNNIINRIKRYPHIQGLSTKANLVIMTDDGTMGEQVLKDYHNKSDKILFLRNGVNILSKPMPNIDETQFKKSMGIPLNKTILLTVSRLVEWKKVNRAIEGLAKLQNKQDYFLIIVGEGEERKNLEGLVSKLKIETNVLFTGAVKNEDVYKYMKVADIFLSFYDLSNVGNPLLEALALGKPIITYNVGETNKVINGKNGILLDDITPENIAKTIEYMNKEEILKQYSEAAREYTEKELYSWEKRMDIELQEVKKLLDKEVKEN